MASMRWGGVDIPLPDKDGITVTYEPISVSRRMLSGKLRVDLAACKAVIRVRWSGLTSEQHGQLMQTYTANLGTPTQLIMPDGTTYDQVVAATEPAARREIYDVRDQPYYTVTITFEEV